MLTSIGSMQNQLPKCIVPSGNTKGDRILPAFCKSFNGQILRKSKHKHIKDLVIFGLKNPKLFKICDNFWYIDNGYFLQSNPRSKMNGYYRIVRNSFYSSGKEAVSCDKRFNSFKVKLSSWRKGGSKIILVPPSNYLSPVINEKDWLVKTKTEIRKYSDRPIEVSTKKKPINWNDDIWCIVVCSSNILVDSLIRGIPVISTRFTNIGSLKEIENPPSEDSRKILYRLANLQWNMKEIKNGLAWSMLNDSRTC